MRCRPRKSSAVVPRRWNRLPGRCACSGSSASPSWWSDWRRSPPPVRCAVPPRRSGTRSRLARHGGSGPARGRARLVDRGDSVAFRLEALGRRTATLWLRAPGEAWHPVGVRLDSLGRAVVSSGPLTSDVYRPGDQRQPLVRHGAGEGPAARVSRRAHRDRALPALPGTRERAGADRRRHADSPGGYPARDQGGGDGAAHGRRLGARRPPRGARGAGGSRSPARSCPPRPASTVWR